MATAEQIRLMTRTVPKGPIGKSVLEQIGNTPLLRLERVGSEFPAVEFAAKAEWFNPGGSVKDRAALAMIEAGLRTGELLPGSASEERKRILQAYGAELVITPGDEGTDGAIRRVRELAADQPEKYFYPDQYSNPDNWRAHYRTTANEIWEQTQGRITHFVAALGTSGTFTGTTRRLRELNPEIRCISLQPDGPWNGLEGWKHMPTALRPPIYDETLVDENLEISTEEAYRMVKRLARAEGLLVSPSAAAALLGCFKVAEELETGRPAVIVTVFADNASKYLSERFWFED